MIDKIFTYIIDDDVKTIEINELFSNEYLKINNSGMLELTKQHSTNRFFRANSSREFSNEVYDLSSKYFNNWDEELWFDANHLSDFRARGLVISLD